MHVYRFLFILVLLAIGYNFAKAQDVNIKCPDTVLINSCITTYGYNYNEIDTILVKTYIGKNGFKKAKDSFYVYTKDVCNDQINKTRFIEINETKEISNIEDWEIIFKNKKSYKISDVKTDIIIERHQFKRCRMVSFMLDGKTHKAQNIEITKPGFKKKKVALPKKRNKDVERLIL